MAPDNPSGLQPILVSESGTPITHLGEWQKQREMLRQQWLNFLGPMPERPPVALKKLSEEQLEGCRRIRVRYSCETGIYTEGYLLIPEAKDDSPRPALVVLHFTTKDTIEEVSGVKGRNSRALGLKLAQQGFVVFCPRCFLWDDPSLDYYQAAARFQGRHPNTLGMRKMLNDAQMAVDILVGLPEVDATRIGAIGHSLGAKESLYLAAFDERIKAAVASEGGIGLDFTNWDAPWYLGDSIHKPGFTLNHHQLLALFAPRAFLIVAGGSESGEKSVADGNRTWPFVEAALPVYRLYGGTPRLALYNHGQGHTVPDEAFARMQQWLAAYL
jgi:hypothetical protein